MIEFRTTRGTGAAASTPDYDAIYREAPIQQIDSFYLWALRLARVSPGQRLLDVSCGVARLVEFAQRRGIRSVGIDLSGEAIAVARRAGVRGELLVGNAQELPFPEASFDRVINLGSIEHYEHPDRAVAEMARVLRPDGRAVILLPNSFGYQHVLYVWRHGTIFDDGQPLQRYATRAAWNTLLEANGLSVEEIAKYQQVWPRTVRDLGHYLRQPRKFVQVLLTPLLPVDTVNCLVFLCRKRNSRTRLEQ